MKTLQLRWIAPLLALATGAISNPAQAATLKVGDAAPKLQVSKWLQGEPVKEFARDKVYLVEFWATWCPPCRASIPHLNELHNKFKGKGLIVIGQDVWERDVTAVGPFVKKMGEEMTYRVALDTVKAEKGKMAETWMEAAGQDGIPTAFVVDKGGRIAWIGHPMQLKEEMLAKVLEGNFDVSSAAADYARQQKQEEEMSRLWREFNHLAQKEQWDPAEMKLAEIEKLLPEDQRGGVEMRRFQFLLERGDYQRAYKLAGAMSDKHPDDALMQNEIAWTIATKYGLAERDLDLAEKIARRADAAAKKEDSMKAEILDTLARVLFLKDQKEPAIELQQRAVQFAEGGRKSQFQKNLDDYKAGRAPQEAQINGLRRAIERALQKKDWRKAQSSLAELEKLLPKGAGEDLDGQRFRILLAKQDYDEAAKMAEHLSSGLPDNAMVLNQIAWEIALSEGNEERELELAEKIAREASKATNGKNAEILDTLARLLFLRGQKEKAIEFQQKAVQFAKGRRQGQFQETLEAYKGNKLPNAY